MLPVLYPCLLYTSDAADERSSVDLGGRRILKKKTTLQNEETTEEIRNKDQHPDTYEYRRDIHKNEEQTNDN